MTETMHKVESRRDELMMRGIINQMPLDAIDTSKIYGVKLQFCRPDTIVTNLSDPWNPTCIVSEIFRFSITALK
jgi:hypothetical protein